LAVLIFRFYRLSLLLLLMPLSLTTVERRILAVLAALIVLGLIGYAVL